MGYGDLEGLSGQKGRGRRLLIRPRRASFRSFQGTKSTGGYWATEMFVIGGIRCRFVSAQTASSVRLLAPTLRKIRFRYSLIVPSARCSSWAISLLSFAWQTSVITCFSRKLSVGFNGRLLVFGAAQLGQMRFPLLPRNSAPHRQQFRVCVSSIMFTTLTCCSRFGTAPRGWPCADSVPVGDADTPRVS